MLRFRNERLREPTFVVSGTTYTPVSLHSTVVLNTPWFVYGASYRRPGWIEIEGTGRRVRIVDVLALVRLVVATMAFLLATRRVDND